MDSCSSIQDAPREAPPLTESGSSQKEIVGYQFKLKTAKKGSACTAFPRHASRSCGPPSVASHTPVRCFQEGLREWENWKCIWHNSSFELPALRAGGKKKWVIPLEKRKRLPKSSFLDFSVSACGEENGSWRAPVSLSSTRDQGISPREWKTYFRRWWCVQICWGKDSPRGQETTSFILRL